MGFFEIFVEIALGSNVVGVVVVLPAVVPVLLSSVSATQIVLAGEPLDQAAAWLKLLAAADLVYLVVGVLTFEFVLEG